MTKYKNATEWVANYIKEQSFSIEQIVSELQISEEKLRIGSEAELEAVEFLELCAYLGVTPEQIREETGA